MGAFRPFLLATLLAVTRTVPVKQSPRLSMLDQFGPPSEAHSAAVPEDESHQLQSTSGELADRDSSIPLPTCPPRSRCVPSSQCSSDVITYEQPQDIYHPTSQYDRPPFTPRFTCGQSAPDYVCCREEGVRPYHGSSQENPFGFPGSLGSGDFHHDPPPFSPGFGSSSTPGFSSGSGSSPGSSSGSGFDSSSVSGSPGGLQQVSSFDPVPGFGLGSGTGSFVNGFGTDPGSSTGSFSGSDTASDFGSSFGPSMGSFAPGNSDFTQDPISASDSSSAFSTDSATGFGSGASLGSGFGSSVESVSSGDQGSSSNVGSGSGSSFGLGPDPSEGFAGSPGSSAVLPDSSSAFAGFGGSSSNANAASQGLDVRHGPLRSPGAPSFGGMLPPGMPPIGPGMPPPGMGMPPGGPLMFPPGAGDFPPPGAFPSSSSFSPTFSGISATSGFSPNTDGFMPGSSFFDPGSSGPITPGATDPIPARRRLQQVLIRGQQHTLPEFSSVLALDGGAEALITHGTQLRSMEVRPVPGFTRTGRSQTVLVAGRPHVTGEFVFVSDPGNPPIIVTTEGVPGQLETEGGEQAGELEPFVPLPELVMLAAEIFRQIGGLISQQSPPDSAPFQPPPPPAIATSLRPPSEGPPPTRSGPFGTGQAAPSAGDQPGSFDDGQTGSFAGGQTAPFGGVPPAGASFGGVPPAGASFGGVSLAEAPLPGEEDSYVSFEGETSRGDPSFGGPHMASGAGQGHGHGFGHDHRLGHGHGHGHRPSPPYGHGHHPHQLHRPPLRRPPPYGLRHGYPGHRRPLLPPPRFHGPYLPHQLSLPVAVSAETCGRRGQLRSVYESVFGAFSSRISSGFGLEPGVADYASHPWHAAILRRTAPQDPRGLRLGGLQYICGATLISEDALITAAHCVQAEREGDLVIRLGEYNLYSDREELYKPYDARVRAIHVHPDYRSSVYLADLAVLQLTSPVPLASLPHVTPACLPGPDLSGEHVTCEAPGWGYDAYKTQLEDAPHALKAVAVRPTPVDACEATLQATLLGPAFHLQPGSFCAVGSHGQDTCLGDGGGGLVCPRAPSPDDPAQFQLVGVTSWGVRCGDGTPGVYTNVAAYREWIQAILESSPSLPIMPIPVPFF